MLEERRLITTCPTKLFTAYGLRNGNLLYHIEPIVLAIQYRDYIAKQRIEAEHERLKARRALLKQHRESVRTNNWRERLERRKMMLWQNDAFLMLCGNFPTLYMFGDYLMLSKILPSQSSDAMML